MGSAFGVEAFIRFPVRVVNHLFTLTVICLLRASSISVRFQVIVVIWHYDVRPHGVAVEGVSRMGAGTSIDCGALRGRLNSAQCAIRVVGAVDQWKTKVGFPALGERFRSP